MAAVDCLSFGNPNSLFDWKFKCDFCPITFRTEESFDSHILEHFEKKNCWKCDKLLLRIGSKWYELHIDDVKPIEPEDGKSELLETVAEIKVENGVSDDGLDDTEINCNAEVEAVLSEETSSQPSSFSSPSSSSTDSDDDQIEAIPPNKKRKRVVKGPSTVKSAKKSSEGKNDGLKRRKGRLPRIKCQICERIILKYNFEVHLLKMHVPNVITSKERVNCQTCGKSFASIGTLKTHQAVHSETRRFVCNFCGSSFRQLYHLTEHMNAHTGNKPYHCQVCDKRFGRLHVLRAHQRIHTGEKPHKCNIDGCDRAYAYDIDLKRHKFSAHGIYTKKHVCSICSKLFSENKLLKKHLESHSAGNIRPAANEATEPHS